MKKYVDYEVNMDTLAIISVDKNKTRILESNKDYIINSRSLNIMENSCICFGSSLEGRQKGSASILGVSYKVPIIISDEKELIFFPTSSPRLDTCSWIAMNKIRRYYNDSGRTIIEFNNGRLIELEENFGIIDNQYYKSIKLEKKIREQKSLKE